MLPSEMNEKVLAYQAGDRHAADPVYLQMRGFMGYAARRNGNIMGYDGLEAFSDAEEVFTQCLNTWHPEGGFQYFLHYAKQHIVWKLSTNRYKVTLRNQKHLAIPCSHTELLYCEGYDRQAQLEARGILSRLAALPEGRLRDIVMLKAKGLSNVQAGKALGVSNQYVSKLLKEYRHAI